MSDLHRGCGDKADDFAQNEQIYLKLMQHYFQKGFHMVEVGDADDIWECPDFTEIKRAHPLSFVHLSNFSDANLYDRVSGNHDRELGHPEALVIKHHGLKILVVHGHQGDWFNDNQGSVGKWFTRNIWRKLQWLGFRDPTSAQKERNPKKHEATKITLKEWAKTRATHLVCGHTHFQETGAGGYFWNCGSGVQPGRVECIELIGGNFTLIRWNDTGRHVVKG